MVKSTEPVGVPPDPLTVAEYVTLSPWDAVFGLAETWV
jgi:hypothetical protein